MMATDTIHNTLPLGQTGVYVSVGDHIQKKKRVISLHVRNNEQGGESPDLRELLHQRRLVPPVSVSGI